jgi:hypothetical protein
VNLTAENAEDAEKEEKPFVNGYDSVPAGWKLGIQNEKRPSPSFYEGRASL